MFAPGSPIARSAKPSPLKSPLTMPLLLPRGGQCVAIPMALPGGLGTTVQGSVLLRSPGDPPWSCGAAAIGGAAGTNVIVITSSKDTNSCKLVIRYIRGSPLRFGVCLLQSFAVHKAQTAG